MVEKLAHERLKVRLILGPEMSLFLLDETLEFPDPRLARADGLLAIGGDLSVERLVKAYASGIFPWYTADEPILWWSPDPRCVMFTSELKVSRSMRNVLNRGYFEVSFDTDFEGVIRACQQVPRKDPGTWITNEMVQAYVDLYHKGVAHSVEVRMEGNLVGGLYGVSLGRTFFGESMFSRVSNASKVAFVHMTRQIEEWGFEMIDCQIYNDHLASLGARNIGREEFLEKLSQSLKFESRIGSWTDPSR